MMGDLISRQAAIEAIESAKTAQTPDGEIYVAKLNAEMNIQILPSAQPERKKGRWIRMYYNRPRQYTRICSECGEICWFCGIGDYNYCPWCGSRMQEGEEDERIR